ncbi:hypothetical protein L195_g020875 [Trifolium pratense]|uniref:Uncharacterized protein n=1 Tax=Trifolium pratense TaxID=57577 RepID=A0A2K3N3P0_TRIPR|nr:hypothetical protein L195_g020875 [Trifolium pratense]
MWNLTYPTLATTISPSSVSHSILYTFPSAEAFTATCSCTAVVTTQRDSPSDHLCQKDFRYKESVEAFVEPLALIPLLGHNGATKGIIHIELIATTKVSWTPHFYSKLLSVRFIGHLTYKVFNLNFSEQCGS